MRALLSCSLLTMALVFTAIPSCEARTGPLKAIALKGGAYSGSQDYDFGGEKLFDPDSAWSGTVGLSTEWRFGRKAKVHFLLEAQYLPKRIKDTLLDPDTGRPEELTLGLDYLSVPLLAKLRTADSASSLYFLVGFSADFVLSRDEVPDETLNQVFQDLNDTQFSVVVGLGVENSFSRRIDGLFEFRYTQNITDAYGGSDLGEARLNGIRQRGILFQAGLRLRFGRL